MSETTTCTAVRSAAAELALGVVVGAERSAVLAHLESCPDCRVEVQSFAAVTDAIYQLAPAADPPAGFEVRLLARRSEQLQDQGPSGPGSEPAPVTELRLRKPRARRFRAALAAAAVLLVGAGVGLGTLATPGGSRPSVRTAALAWHGVARGNVAVAFGHPAWMFMTVSDLQSSGWVSCVVTERGGREATVGRFLLRNGYGGWAVPLTIPPASITGARIVLDNGTTIASAALPA